MKLLKIYFESHSQARHYRPALKSILTNAFNEWISNTNGGLSWIEVNSDKDADICLQLARTIQTSFFL